MRVALAEQIAATTAQREQLTQQMPMHQKAADRGDHHRQPEHAGQQQSPGIRHVQVHMQIDEEVGEPVDRKSVVSGKSVSGRVELGGRRSINKTKKSNYAQNASIKTD